jgi:hypothetical protein
MATGISPAFSRRRELPLTIRGGLAPPAAAVAVPSSAVKKPRRASAANASSVLYQSETHVVERISVAPDDVVRALNSGGGGAESASIVVVPGTSWAVARVQGGLLGWTQPGWSENSASVSSLSQVVHLDHPGVNVHHPPLVAAALPALMSCSANGELRIWKDVGYPRRFMDLNLDINAAEQKVSAVHALGEDDFICGLSNGALWRVRPSEMSAHPLHTSIGGLGSLLSSISTMVGLTPRKGGQQSSSLESEPPTSAVQRIITISDGDVPLSLIFLEDGRVQAWQVPSSRRESMLWEHKIGAEFGHKLLDVEQVSGGDFLAVMAREETDGSWSQVLLHMSISSAHGTDCTVRIRATLRLDTQGLHVQASGRAQLIVEPIGGDSSARAHIKFLVGGDGGQSSSSASSAAATAPVPSSLVIVTVDISLSTQTASSGPRQSVVSIPDMAIQRCIGCALRPPSGPGLIIFNSRCEVISISHTGHQARVAGAAEVSNKPFMTQHSLTRAIAAAATEGPVDLEGERESNEGAADWGNRLEQAFSMNESGAAAATFLPLLRPLLDIADIPSLDMAVSLASSCLLNATPAAGFEWSAAGGDNGSGSSADVAQQNQLVHYSIAAKIKKHKSFLAFLHSTGLWGGLRGARAKLAEHGEKLAFASILCDLQSRLARRSQAVARILTSSISETLRKRGIGSDELRHAGLSASDLFYSRVTEVLDAFVCVQELEEQLLVGARVAESCDVLREVSEALASLFETALAYRRNNAGLYMSGPRALPWTSSSMARQLLTTQVVLHVRALSPSSRAANDGATILRLAHALLNGFKEQETMRWPPREGARWEEWCSAYEAAKASAIPSLVTATGTSEKAWLLAREHNHFESLLELAVISEDLKPVSQQGLAALRPLMNELREVQGTAAPHLTFPEFAMRWLHGKGKLEYLMDLGALSPAIFQRFLIGAGEPRLLWLLQVSEGSFRGARDTLQGLSAVGGTKIEHRHTLLSIGKLCHLASVEQPAAADAVLHNLDLQLALSGAQIHMGVTQCDDSNLDRAVPAWKRVLEAAAREVDASSASSDEQRGARAYEAAALGIKAAAAALEIIAAEGNSAQHVSEIKKGAALIWRAVIVSSIAHEAITDLVAKIAADIPVSDQEIEDVWKGGTLLYTVLSMLNVQGPAALSDSMLAKALEGLALSDDQMDVYILILRKALACAH